MNLFNIGSTLFAGLFVVTLMTAWIVDRINQARRADEKKVRENVHPCDGGCWYCHKEDCTLSFSWEFDCYVHKECLRQAIADYPKDVEARIMGAELLAPCDCQPWETNDNDTQR